MKTEGKLYDGTIVHEPMIMEAVPVTTSTVNTSQARVLSGGSCIAFMSNVLRNMRGADRYIAICVFAKCALATHVPCSGGQVCGPDAHELLRNAHATSFSGLKNAHVHFSVSEGLVAEASRTPEVILLQREWWSCCDHE